MKKNNFANSLIFLLLFVVFISPVHAFFCPNCGHDFTTGEKFCSQCGLSLEDIEDFITAYREYDSQRKELISFKGNPLSPDTISDTSDENRQVHLMSKSQSETYVGNDSYVVAVPENNQTVAAPVTVTVAEPIKEPGDESRKTLTGSLEIVLVYQGNKPETYSKSGRVYINDKLLGSIYMLSPSEASDKKGYSTDLFGYATGLGNKRYYKFTSEKIPTGTYQVKVALQKKGFLRRSSRFRYWKNVKIEAAKEEKLYYSWGDSQDFGE